MNKEEFFEILNEPNPDGFEIHLQYLFEVNDFKRLFKLTGIDFSEMLKDKTKEENNIWLCTKDIKNKADITGKILFFTKNKKYKQVETTIDDIALIDNYNTRHTLGTLKENFIKL